MSLDCGLGTMTATTSKKMLSGNKYMSSSLGSAIYQCLQQIPKEYLSVFCDWMKRLQKCVSIKGEYFDLKVCNKNMFDKTKH